MNVAILIASFVARDNMSVIQVHYDYERVSGLHQPVRVSGLHQPVRVSGRHQPVRVSVSINL